MTERVRPQPSERWAMYRLICPVVDVAVASNGLDPYFEFSQPNGPNKRLSADIALMQGGHPIWLIEAKKFTQKLHPNLVGPYLKSGVMGVVTNGNDWVVVVQTHSTLIGPMVQPNGTIDLSVRNKIIHVLSLTTETAVLEHVRDWTDSWQEHRPARLPPVWRLNEGLGSREFDEKTTFESLKEAVRAARLKAIPESPTALLLEELSESGAEISAGKVEVSDKRLVWLLPNGKRGIRLNLASRQVDMLVLNALLDAVGRSNVQATIKLHDKNHAMSICRASTLPEIRSLLPIFSITMADMASLCQEAARISLRPQW